MALKTIEEQLADALDKIKAKSAAAAKKIQESAITIEEKLATCYELIEGSTRCGQLTQLIRESSYAFDGPPTPKHNGVTDNTPHRESADESDKAKQQLAVVAQRAFNLSESEARIFADLDDRAENLKAALMREGGRR